MTSSVDRAWARAARLGGLWAGSEIVLGSFLHNLRVPLRGHAMTALSAVLLAAAHRRRPERGLLWRSGLVCAALKSVSPSAVLLGPMIAIAAEGFMMEAGTAILPGAAGRVLGGGLAMAWIPLHLAGRAALLYGLDAARLYEAAWGRARAPLGLEGVGAWELLGLVWALHFAAGAAAVLLAPMLAARRGARAPSMSAPPLAPVAAAKPRWGTSWAGLALDVVLILASLRLIKSLSPAGAGAFTAALTVLWAWWYPGAARRLARPGVWLGVLMVGLAAGALLGSGGAEAGLRMALRALALTAGFAALSQELAAPAVRARFAALGAGRWLVAVEAAFASLPAVIARLPPAWELLRRPADALSALLEAAEPPPLYLVAGASGVGKSAFLAALAARLRGRGVSVGGIVSPGLWDGATRAGFDLEDLADGRREPLSRRDGPAHWPALTGPFRFSPAGVAFGRAALARTGDTDVLIVDEVGPLELSGGGWAAEIESSLARRAKPLVWAVRESLVEAVQARWSVPAAAVWPPSTDPAAAADELAAAISS